MSAAKFFIFLAENFLMSLHHHRQQRHIRRAFLEYDVIRDELFLRLRKQHLVTELDRLAAPTTHDQFRMLLKQRAGKLGIVDALGDSLEARPAPWQIIARTIDQGSRLSAVRTHIA